MSIGLLAGTGVAAVLIAIGGWFSGWWGPHGHHVILPIATPATVSSTTMSTGSVSTATINAQFSALGGQVQGLGNDNTSATGAMSNGTAGE